MDSKGNPILDELSTEDTLVEDEQKTEEEIQQLSKRLESQEKRQALQNEGEEEKSHGSVRKILTSPLAAIILSLAALGLTILNMAGVGPLAPVAPPPSEAEIQKNLEMSLRFAREEIEIFSREHGRLPQSLSETALSEDQGFTYRKTSDGGFELTVTLDGRSKSMSETLDLKEPENPTGKEEKI